LQIAIQIVAYMALSGIILMAGKASRHGNVARVGFFSKLYLVEVFPNIKIWINKKYFWGVLEYKPTRPVDVSWPEIIS